MCLLKVYVEYPESGERVLIAGNIAFISMEGEGFKLLDIEYGEKVVLNVIFSAIDALNSTLILKAKGRNFEVKG